MYEPRIGPPIWPQFGHNLDHNLDQNFPFNSNHFTINQKKAFGFNEKNFSDVS